ncbi:hypothetical protein KKI24_03440 [bacterium]|nr:hypothetical protein [bacterium]
MRQKKASGYRIERQTLLQPVDHENPGGETFEQEIHILTPDGATNSSPVFFVLGNEKDAKPDEIIQLHTAYGEPDQVIFILVEHRGYGQSVTTDPDQACPEYLTIEQTLADYHRFVTIYKETYHGPWMAGGYSYGGGLVVHYAYLYPEDVQVILSSSGIVDPPFFIPEYDWQVKTNLGPYLYGQMARHTNALKPMEPFDQTWLEREFLMNMSSGISQRAELQPLVPLFRILSFLPTQLFIRILRWLDRKAPAGEGWTGAISFGKQALSREEAITGEYNWYTWKYQQAKETGTFFVSDEPHGLFCKTREETIEECRLMFGEDPPAVVNPPWNIREMLESLKVQVVFVNGGRDPWYAICQKKVDWIKEEDYFFVEDAHHCPDKIDHELGKRVFSRVLSYTE